MTLAALPEINALTSPIIGAAIEVHRHLGPGLLESVYHECLALELSRAGIKFECQRRLPVVYKGITLGDGFRLDFVVDERVIVEIKSVDAISEVYHAQLLTYLKFSGCPAGLLINFNVPVLKDGIVRVLNTLRAPVPPR
jgi:GxxExxY protein